MSLRRGIFSFILAFIIVGVWSPVATAEAPYVVILLVDGARGDLVQQLAADGRLPNIQKLFMEEGLVVDKGLTVFPTTSTNAYQSFMTGLFPGHAGIPYLARYSRSENESIEYLSLKGIKIMNADLLNWYQLNDPDVPFQITQGSLFDHLPELRTASVYSTFRRGADLYTPRVPWGAAWDTFVLGEHEKLDIRAYKRLKKLYEGPTDQIPHLSFTALLSTDVLAHLDGAKSPRVLAHYETIDRMIADFWSLLERRGLADQTYLILVGDHGNHDISQRSYLRERLIKQGVAIRSRHMRPPYELAINARGVSCAIISVAGTDGWKSFPTLEDLRHVPTLKGKELDLIEYLRHQPETDLLLVRDGNHHVRIFNTVGDAEVTRLFRGGRYWYSYHVLRGDDPLHYMEDPKLAPLIRRNTPLTAAQWLPLTADKKYADAIVQIGQIFTDGRVGDLMIVPKHDWVFRHEKSNTHGGLSQEDMHIPILIRGPGIAPQHISYARSVDLMPTILSWFGKTTPHRDGQDLLNPDPPPAPMGRQSIRIERDTLQRRIAKLTALKDRCGRKRATEDRLTRPDRVKKMRVSTCEVVDLALKTAYEDLQRLGDATVHTVQHP